MPISIPMITIAPSTQPIIILCDGELSTTKGIGCVELSVETVTLSGFLFSVTGLFSTVDVVTVVALVVEYGSLVEVIVTVPVVVELFVVIEDLLGVIPESLLGAIHAEGLGSDSGAVKLMEG